MNGLKEIWPLFAIVIILGSLVGMNVMKSRPSPEQIKEVHNEMKAERDSFMTFFKGVAFDLEVADNNTFVRKYPMPDVRYELSVNNSSSLVIPEGMSDPSPFYDGSQEGKAIIWAGPKGKHIRKGNRLKKELGQEFYLVHKANGEVDTMDLEWRLFVQEELYK
ncbi:MAG: hypothetical protein MRZ79_09730 [Bacteroidia bacterium]|nr:hypothetical protein [Bacteroidia bacterium]